VLVQLQGIVEREGKTYHGARTPPVGVTPRADPDAPSGFILINGGAAATTSPAVTLEVNASDVPLDGLPGPGSAATVAHAWSGRNEISGDVEVRFSNRPPQSWTAWEALTPRRSWQLRCDMGKRCRVYAQFRDAALNESLVVSDAIWLQGIYLPLVVRAHP
jgi:hypothetical protein